VTRYYPAYLNLTDKRCVVIGAGVVAERKVTQLLASDANVTLVSPTATDVIEKLTAAGKVEWHKRTYQQGDLAGATLAIAATDDEPVNREVHAEAQRENTLLNVVDVTPLCGFIAPSIVERGAVTVAISTSGSSPALARKLRELMNGDQNPEHHEAQDGTYCRCLQWADAAGVLGDARAEIRAQGTSAAPETWQAAMTTELLELVQAGKTDEAKDRLLDALLATAH
jgi:precorrin-2 dehydrogenase / sirohydrochlorin ferrochelatase